MKHELSTSVPLSNETSNDFTFRNRAVRGWLGLVILGSIAIVSVFPPAFWLCGLGAALLAIGSTANSARTGQWMSWQNEGSLSWFEGWLVSTAAAFLVAPLVAIVVRSWLS